MTCFCIGGNPCPCQRGSVRMVHDYPMRQDPMFWAQTVLPRNLTMQEAERLCAFIMTLAQPE